MQPSNMSDAGNLADSAYEIIHGADIESQDGLTSESTGFQSSDDFENPYNADSDEESDDASNASSIRYADQALQSPSSQLPTSSLEYGSTAEASGVVVGSIELQEVDGGGRVLPEKISAKHAIREFSKEESSAIAQHIGLADDAPKCLVASIRQTMSASYLSTQEPLRVLYVGRADAQRSIVLKLCSAIWVSPKNGGNDHDYFNRHRDGLYNIVPISSFGPTPELDLMEASRYQIKVEYCTAAEEINRRDPFLGHPAYSLTIDQDKSYTSILSPDGPTVCQEWDLPHIAVFYCSGRDDAHAERTRDFAWSFMSRHGVPSIFITEEQDFHNPDGAHWGRYIDEGVVHLSLESRDPERPMAPMRFPIDYASFADIDARQMNRNLAFLTGLSDLDETTVERDATKSSNATSDVEADVLPAFHRAKRTYAQFAEAHNLNRWIFTLVIPILVSLIAPFLLALLAGWLRSGRASHLQSLSSTDICASPPTYPRGFTTSTSLPMATTTTTVVINVTSTKTVQVSQAKPSTSALVSALSFAGLLSDKPSAVPANTETKSPVDSAKKTSCSVKVYSRTELLVAIPSRNKAVWLAKGAIDIAVRRSDDLIRTKISSVDEGVLVELAPKDAHGQLNVSVVTNRRPKINETFQVDLGTTPIEEVFEAVLHLLHGTVRKLSSSMNGASGFIEDTVRIQSKAISVLERASEAVRNHTTGAIKRATDNVREHVAHQLESAEVFLDEIDLSVLQAQIASKLWWLKIKGKVEEYAEYERNASRFLKMKHDEVLNSQGGQARRPPKEARSFFAGLRSMIGSRGTEGCAKRTNGARGARSTHAGWYRRWKKLTGRL